MRPPRDRGATIVRLLRLWGRVQGTRYAPPLQLLAEEFGVTTRTIRRDFEVLESVGYVVPKWADRNRRTA